LFTAAGEQCVKKLRAENSDSARNAVMKTKSRTRPITIFTPSSAGEDNTNAQNLTVKEIVARLPSEQFQVIMISEGKPDPRIASRRNTELIPWTEHWNTVRLLKRCLLRSPDIYFFPRYGPLDRAFFDSRKYLGKRTALVSYVVMMMNDLTGRGLIGRSIVEADRLCVNSRYVGDTVREKFGLDSTTIHDGVDRRFFFPRRRGAGIRGSNPLVVLYAGSLQPRKRVELVIQEAVRRPGVQFRLAGSGETEKRCRALCREHNCHNVFFLGRLSSSQLGEEMRKADVFFFPSILEGHPQVLGQAAACGLPAVAMNVYRPDYVVHGETGFLAGLDADLSEKLDVLLRDSELRHSMASAAARHSRKFDWDQITEQWIEVFQDVVAERQGA
jgi:glycosyltransferase involved in cell wall biosynthesis